MTPAVRLLDTEGVAYDLHEYERGDDLRDFGREAAESLGLPFEQVFKTLLVDVVGAGPRGDGGDGGDADDDDGGADRGSGSDGASSGGDVGRGRGGRRDSEVGETVVVVVPVSCLVSMKHVALAVGAKKAAMCDPGRAERITGYVVGGISPLGQKKRQRTVLDESVVLFDRIYVSGGRRGLDISVAPDDLARLLDATIAPITA